MPKLGELVAKVRSKNAGPFWLTIDIFCGSKPIFDRVSRDLETEAVARLLKTTPGDLKRFDIASLNVVKISLPRPQVQGTIRDRDMHGAATAVLLAEMEIG